MDVIFGAVTAEQRERDLRASENAENDEDPKGDLQKDLDGKGEIQHKELDRHTSRV